MDNTIVVTKATPAAGNKPAVVAAKVETPKSNLSDIRTPVGDGSIGFFDGKKRFVKYDLNAFAEMERLYGDMTVAQEKLSTGSMTDIRRMLWVGVIHDEAILDDITGEPISYNLTIYQVGKWLNPDNMKEVMSKLSNALSGSMPAADVSDATTEMNINMEAVLKEIAEEEGIPNE